ncbi:putative membrane protein [Propionispora sp. 2/2-37]|uniref:hypothetical protein n=1 Tax=Propionispora sp. 2/2-37 TaxID=1677858 RepID=UPI0006BB961D|nr:hypothetical protein [Propionispora sp. 2/2-37]CUH94547.1 putative membrane protein [Propionispora sp. 2/2-37]
MADLKKHMLARLRSARHWLVRAEESFDKERDIRGELDLLLAQAELQRVKEEHRSSQWRYKYPLLRHGLALSLALMAGAIGTGGAYWWQQEAKAVYPVPAAVHQQAELPVSPAVPQIVEQRKSLPEVLPSDGEEPPEQPAGQTAYQPPQNRPVAPQVTHNNSTDNNSSAAAPVHAEVVSPAEMQKLVRVAGQSLRGQ